MLALEIREELKNSSMIYVSCFFGGVVFTLLVPEVGMQLFIYLQQAVTSSPVTKPATSAILVGEPTAIFLTIFMTNLIFAAIIFFIITGILYFAMPYVLAGVRAALWGVLFTVATLEIFPSLSVLAVLMRILTILFEGLAYVVACATGVKIGKRSQSVVHSDDYLKFLLIPVHLFNAEGRSLLKQSLNQGLPWVFTFTALLFIAAVVETIAITVF